METQAVGSHMTSKKGTKPFDKYYYYSESVQSPESDVEFIRGTYKSLRGKNPETFREDFCGTFAICCNWVETDEKTQAYGVDYDPEPIKYGSEHYFSKLEDSEQDRVHVQEGNVLTSDLPQADVACALNFSYFSFKDRKTLGEYFKNAYKATKDDGLLILDCFGGSKCYEANEEETEHEDEGFSYFWDQDSFDPISNEAMFYIHFQRKGEAKREKAFTYDWRLWSIPEIKELLIEAGYRQVGVYWEGTEEDGSGDGEFTRQAVGEECESWIAYIVAEK